MSASRWQLANKDRINIRRRANYAADPAKQKAASLRYHAKFPELQAPKTQRWRKQNPAKARAIVRNYQAAKIQRTPLWADMKKIEDVYAEADTVSALLGETCEVDHVIPLQGKLVSGLHVHTNLQVLRGTDNARKHNTFTP